MAKLHCSLLALSAAITYLPTITFRAPQLLSYHPIYGGAEMEPRYISEPQLHAQAPKYSKIMPSRPIRVGQATSIREIPAM